MSGDGVAQDTGQAFKLFGAAADQADPRGLDAVCTLIFTRKVPPPDPATTLGWYRKGADQGRPVCQTFLGQAYAQGQGLPSDSAEAVKWYRLSADQGEPLGQFDLALAYAQGIGVEKDLVQAYLWFSLAAQRMPEALGTRDVALKNRDLAAAGLTPAQLAEAQGLVQAWTPAPRPK